MNRKEVQAQQQDVVACRNSNTVVVREPKLKVDLTKYVEEHSFLFDQSFDETVSNEQLYSACVRPAIDAVFQRAKCTCFAYGQTGSGKTFTMMGPSKKQSEGLDGKGRTPGIFLLAAQDIFRGLGSKEHGRLGVDIAFYEIYCGKLFDLLNGRQLLHARENASGRVIVQGLKETAVQNVQELMEVIEFGLNSRTVGVTGANVDSSRSHAILQISLKDASRQDGRDREGSSAGPGAEHGKISFIDLAGSERGADTLDTDRQTRMDGAEINKSLLALKECIRALDQQHDHTPFRGSKLTQVLKDSFVGSNCRTVMIANVSPNSSAVDHTLNTLRYAYRVKELQKGGGAAPAGTGRPPGAAWGAADQAAPADAAGGAVAAAPGAPPGAPPPGGELVIDEASSDDGDSPRDISPEVPAGPGEADARASSRDRAPQQRSVADLRSTLGPSPAAPPPGAGAGAAGGSSFGSFRLPPAPVPRAAQGPPAREREEGSPPAACSHEELDDLARQHDRLIGTILAEEEELITAHRTHIDAMVALIKEEMVQLNNVDRPGSDVEAYVSGLDRILRQKEQYIGDIRQRVDLFKDHLQQEDTLSRRFTSLAAPPPP